MRKFNNFFVRFMSKFHKALVRVRAMDQIANRNVAPSSAPAENHTFVQEMVADMHFNVETPPSDVKDPGKPTTSIEINLLIASENNNKENQITENLGKKVPSRMIVF